MATHWNPPKTHWHVIDAWHAAHQPNAITQALTIGEQITDLLIEATTLVQRARWNTDSIIEDAYIRCQAILDRLTDEANKLAPVLIRLRAASKAVVS